MAIRVSPLQRNCQTTSIRHAIETAVTIQREHGA